MLALELLKKRLFILKPNLNIGNFYCKQTGFKQWTFNNNPVRFFQSTRFAASIQSIHVPAMGDSISEGTVVEIVKNVGDYVKVDDIVVVLETDKVSVDVRAPEAGHITQHHAKIDDNVLVGAPLFSLDTEGGETLTAKASSPAQETTKLVINSQSEKQFKTETNKKPYRQPLIKFLGKRILKDNTNVDITSTLAKNIEKKQLKHHPVSQSVLIDDLPSLFGRLSVSKMEMEAIESGFYEL